MSGYQVTGEPDPSGDAEAFQIYREWGCPLDPDRLIQAVERTVWRDRPCVPGRMFVCPDDFAHLQELGIQRASISRPDGSLPTYGPLFGVPVLVDTGLARGLIKLTHCTNTREAAHGCRYGLPVYLDTFTGLRHSDRYCADAHWADKLGLLTTCIEGTRYTPCTSPDCPGACIDVGGCSCVCHR